MIAPPSSTAEGLADAAHAADRLQHGRRLVPAFAEIGLEAPEVRIENPVQIERLAQRAGLRPAAGRLAVAGPAGALIRHVAVECAERAQPAANPLLVAGADSLVQRIVIHRLRGKFGDVAADVVDHLPVAHRFAVERRIVLQQGAAVVVGHDLQATPSSRQYDRMPSW